MNTVKSLVRHAFSLTPYEIRHRQTRRELPPGTFESIQLVLAHYLICRPGATFVQIGACDGVSEDPVHDFIRTGGFQALLVEPIPENFDRLRKSYEGAKNVVTARVAIGDQDGEIDLFKVKEGSQSKDPYWARQLASFDRAHLVRHGVSSDDIEMVRVPCLTLSSLIERYHLDKIDILQVDTEGFDAEVVGMALRLPIPPECLYFENFHLDAGKTPELFSRLQTHGYSWIHGYWNTLAVHKRVIDRLLSPLRDLKTMPASFE
jgi:FkbM family methyltransferase